MAEKKAPPRENDFEWGRSLGEGAFGQVKLGTLKESGKQFAVKMIDKNFIKEKKGMDIVLRERDVLNAVKHHFVIGLFSTFSTSTHLYFVLEYCPNGEMFNHIRNLGSLSMECSKFYAAELISAMEYIHSKGIIHRDLKPENILLDEKMHIRVIDFGTAKAIGTTPGARTKSFEGTVEYMSAELLGENACSGLISDLWALGCIIYQFLVGKPPFKSSGTHWQTMQLIRSRNFVFPENMPPVARDLIDRLLEPNPEKRLGANGYHELKSHPFFNDIQWDRLKDLTPPKLEPMNPPLVFQEKKATMSTGGEKKATLKQTVPSQWSKFLSDGEQIIETGTVFKKRRMFNIKKRQLILTDEPRLFYIDPENGEYKGTIPWSSELYVIQKDDRHFDIHTPKRVYMMDDRSRAAGQWAKIIHQTRDENRRK